MKSYADAHSRFSGRRMEGGALRRLAERAPILAWYEARGSSPLHFHRAGKRLQESAIGFVDIVAPENKDHLVDLILGCEEFSGGFYSDLRSFLEWIAVGAATDRRKGYRLDSVFHRNLQRISVAICQGLRLAMCSAMPDRSDGVDDESSGQTIATSDFRFAGFTAAKCTAFPAQFGSSGAMNRSVDSAAAEKRRIRRVHNRVNLLFCDVPSRDLNIAVQIFLHEQSYVCAPMKAMRRRIALQKRFAQNQRTRLFYFAKLSECALPARLCAGVNASLFRISSFGLPSTFVIRHSSFLRVPAARSTSPRPSSVCNEIGRASGCDGPARIRSYPV